MSGQCRYLFGDVLFSERIRPGRVSVGTCSVMSGYCRDVFGEVGLASGLVQRRRVVVGMYSERSA